jgi:hypothetical protein
MRPRLALLIGWIALALFVLLFVAASLIDLRLSIDDALKSQRDVNYNSPNSLWAARQLAENLRSAATIAAPPLLVALLTAHALRWRSLHAIAAQTVRSSTPR